MPPTKLAHLVYQTNRMAEMRDWYCAVLGARVVYEDKHLSFVTYDDEHHRVAFLDFGPLAPRDPAATELGVQARRPAGPAPRRLHLRLHGRVPRQLRPAPRSSASRRSSASTTGRPRRCTTATRTATAWSCRSTTSPPRRKGRTGCCRRPSPEPDRCRVRSRRAGEAIPARASRSPSWWSATRRIDRAAALCRRAIPPACRCAWPGTSNPAPVSGDLAAERRRVPRALSRSARRSPRRANLKDLRCDALRPAAARDGPEADAVHGHRGRRRARVLHPARERPGPSTASGSAKRDRTLARLSAPRAVPAKRPGDLLACTLRPGSAPPALRAPAAPDAPRAEVSGRQRRAGLGDVTRRSPRSRGSRRHALARQAQPIEAAAPRRGSPAGSIAEVSAMSPSITGVRPRRRRARGPTWRPARTARPR